MVRRPRVVGAGGIEDADDISSDPWGSDVAFIRAMHKLDAKQAQQEARWEATRERWRTSPCDPREWLEPSQSTPAAPTPTPADSKDDMRKRAMASTLARLERDPSDLTAQAELGVMLRSKR